MIKIEKIILFILFIQTKYRSYISNIQDLLLKLKKIKIY